NAGTIIASYWDTTTTGAAAGVGTGGDTTTGLTTAALSSALPSGFSPAIWGNLNNQTTPYLSTNIGPVYFGAENGSTLYNLVFTPAQLQAVNNNLSGNFALVGNLDLTGIAF